jgi:hypothetical protein
MPRKDVSRLELCCHRPQNAGIPKFEGGKEELLKFLREFGHINTLIS